MKREDRVLRGDFEGRVIFNGYCEACACKIPFGVTRKFGGLICAKCAGELPLVVNYKASHSVSGFGHYDDDPSGASGSWDNIVRAQEEVSYEA